MHLIIDTTKFNELFLMLLSAKGKVLDKNIHKVKKVTDVFLDKFDNLLNKNKVKSNKIKGIGVVYGRGSFTSMRSGVVFANALGYSLNIPIVGIKAEKFKETNQLVRLFMKEINSAKRGHNVHPDYVSEPNITKSKRKLV